MLTEAGPVSGRPDSERDLLSVLRRRFILERLSASVSVASSRRLPFPEALALDHDLVGVVGETVEGALREDRIVEERDPLGHVTIRGQDGRGS